MDRSIQIERLVRQAKDSGGPRVLKPREIRLRLHLFNLTNDWGLFDDVLDEQKVNVMYPNMVRPVHYNDTEWYFHLIDTFGELPDQYREAMLAEIDLKIKILSAGVGDFQASRVKAQFVIYGDTEFVFRDNELVIPFVYSMRLSTVNFVPKDRMVHELRQPAGHLQSSLARIKMKWDREDCTLPHQIEHLMVLGEDLPIASLLQFQIEMTTIVGTSQINITQLNSSKKL